MTHHGSNDGLTNCDSAFTEKDMHQDRVVEFADERSQQRHSTRSSTPLRIDGYESSRSQAQEFQALWHAVEISVQPLKGVNINRSLHIPIKWATRNKFSTQNAAAAIAKTRVDTFFARRGKTLHGIQLGLRAL